MSYRQIEGTTIEVPEWVHLPQFSEFSEAKRARNRFLIGALKEKYFGPAAKGNALKKERPQPRNSCDR